MRSLSLWLLIIIILIVVRETARIETPIRIRATAVGPEGPTVASETLVVTLRKRIRRLRVEIRTRIILTLLTRILIGRWICLNR